MESVGAHQEHHDEKRLTYARPPELSIILRKSLKAVLDRLGMMIFERYTAI
jgi:hypothetical protein